MWIGENTNMWYFVHPLLICVRSGFIVSGCVQFLWSFLYCFVYYIDCETGMSDFREQCCIVMSWGGWRRIWRDCIRKSWVRTIGSSIMTMPHTAVIVQEYLSKNKMPIVSHPPYLPDLALYNFFLLPKMKIKLKGWRFKTAEEIQVESQKVLNKLMKKDFQKAIHIWAKHKEVYMLSRTDLKVMC